MNPDNYSNKNKVLQRRYQKTLSFLLQSANPPAQVLDIGTDNPFSKILRAHGFTVFNTSGADLDLNPDEISQFNADFTTAFEVFEHLLNPLEVLRQVPSNRLFASVPLSLWFTTAYRSQTDPWDRHFHEFEDWQFDWLLEKAGWQIVRREKWTSPVKQIGLRPLLRLFFDRYYIVEALRRTG
ncbi:MAG: methyltransferase domain-containing protein [Cyclobacteriaceae bacterium]